MEGTPTLATSLPQDEPAAPVQPSEGSGLEATPATGSATSAVPAPATAAAARSPNNTTTTTTITTITVTSGRGTGAGTETGEPLPSVDDFIEAHGLNKESHEVLTSLAPDVQEIVMRQFRPKTSQPGSYEVNGKFIMFARSVERGQKGKGKGDKGPAKGQSLGWGPMKGSPCKGGCMDYWGGGWDGGWAQWPPNPWSWGAMGDWGGWNPWSLEWGKGMGKDYWGSPSGAAWGYKGWDEWGKNGKGWKAEGKGAAFENPNVDPPSKDEIEAFCTQWQLNEDARAVLDSLDAATTHSVMKEFKGGESGQVNGRFIVFARGVQKGRFPVGKGAGKGSPKGHSYAPY